MALTKSQRAVLREKFGGRCASQAAMLPQALDATDMTA